jgi:hypothetical protein
MVVGIGETLPVHLWQVEQEASEGMVGWLTCGRPDALKVAREGPNSSVAITRTACAFVEEARSGGGEQHASEAYSCCPWLEG